MIIRKCDLCPQAQKSQYTSKCVYSTKGKKRTFAPCLKNCPDKLLKQCSKLAVTCYRMCGYMYSYSVWSPRQIKQCKKSTKQYKTDRCFFLYVFNGWLQKKAQWKVQNRSETFMVEYTWNKGKILKKIKRSVFAVLLC